MQYRKASSEKDIQGILALQARNYEQNLSIQELQNQGFVTVKHTKALLKEFSGDFQHIVAVDDDGSILAYALVMLRTYAGAIPVLVPMFNKIETLSYQGKPLAKSSYFVMGQICIDKPFRGQGVFAQLYNALQEYLSPHFEYVITEVATRNKRSLRAHEKVGFQTIDIYEAAGEEWAIILWDWRLKTNLGY